MGTWQTLFMLVHIKVYLCYDPADTLCWVDTIACEMKSCCKLLLVLSILLLYIEMVVEYNWYRYVYDTLMGWWPWYIYIDNTSFLLPNKILIKLFVYLCGVTTVFYCGSCLMLHSHCVMSGANAPELVELAFLTG